MKYIVALTRCLKIPKQAQDHQEYCLVFHFKGVYRGERIKSLEGETFTPEEFRVGEDYILYLSDIQISGGRLRGKVFRFKKIGDLQGFL